ncbi:MAG: protein kinase, partial [Polyangiaceae bacterium]
MVTPAPGREVEVFGDFLLVQPIASSPMAEVTLAVRLGERSGRTYVIKRPRVGERPSGAAAQAIAREGEVLEAVRGPGIVSLEAAGELAGLPYVALGHVRGAPLDRVLAHAGALSAAAAAVVALDLVRALAALHAAGWVHGDVAPSNVVIDDAGEVILIDFGLAARSGERRAAVAGKPGYVAPEALRAVPVAAAEDVYGWGVVVAECVLGRRLYPERSLPEAAARADVPPGLAELGEPAAAALDAV